MQVQRTSRQRGISFLGLLLVGVVVAAAGIVLAQVIPTLLEYQAVNKAVHKARDASTVPEARALFDKAAQIDDIKSIRGGDLVISQEGGRLVVRFAYQREIHLAGPVWLTLKYAGRSQ